MKNVFLTGGSRGIGKEIVSLLAKSGYNVCFTYNTNKDMAEAIENELAMFSTVKAVQCDISKPDSIKSAIDFGHKTFGNFDVLVCNAGIAKDNLLQDVDDQEWYDIINTNLSSAFFLSRELVPDMIEKKDGAIVFVTSIWGEVGASMESVYSASKAGLVGFAKSLAKELAPCSVRVNCLSPGAVDTDMMSGYTESELNDFVDTIPLGRLATVSEIAKGALFLVESTYTTGQVLSINGGLVV